MSERRVARRLGTLPSHPKALWQHVARLREQAGDKEGAERARRNARILPNASMRRKFQWLKRGDGTGTS